MERLRYTQTVKSRFALVQVGHF